MNIAVILKICGIQVDIYKIISTYFFLWCVCVCVVVLCVCVCCCCFVCVCVCVWAGMLKGKNIITLV